ncbi:MAG: hypothetical protein CW716_07375 [Candidatus Bathyarchaeum sp.]|nr:MAG: hypothetical protein CW716_07375 [Candidatus Bathyarchaeum sp.]
MYLSFIIQATIKAHSEQSFIFENKKQHKRIKNNLLKAHTEKREKRRHHRLHQNLQIGQNRKSRGHVAPEQPTTKKIFITQ